MIEKSGNYLWPIKQFFYKNFDFKVLEGTIDLRILQMYYRNFIPREAQWFLGCLPLLQM